MGRLKLKGAPPKNLKSAKKIEKAVSEKVVVETQVVEDIEPEGWVKVESLDDLKGPIVLITSDEKRLAALEETGETDLIDLDCSAELFEPSQVRQVVVGKSILPGVFCLQSAYSRYLSSDPIGKVAASKEAIGPSERWAPEIDPSGLVSFKSAFGKYLSASFNSLRADSDELGSEEKFIVKCQAAERWRRVKSQQPQPSANTLSAEELELEKLRKAHVFDPSKNRQNKKDLKQLEDAQREGNLREALLDRRIKTKHDKYC